MQSQYTPSSAVAAPQLVYVGVGRRLVAFIIDLIVLMIINGLVGFIFHAGMTNVNGVISYNSSGPGAALQMFIPIVYYIILEAMWGATLGKMGLGIRVVKVDGSPIGWGGSIMRNLLCVIDGIPFFVPYLLGAILVWTSPTRQRLGDRVARTLVVRRNG